MRRVTFGADNLKVLLYELNGIYCLEVYFPEVISESFSLLQNLVHLKE